MGKKVSAKVRVLLYLGDHANRWVPGYELTQPQVGGSEGLRRLREARDEGWPIEKRKRQGSSAYEYRLVK